MQLMDMAPGLLLSIVFSRLFVMIFSASSHGADGLIISASTSPCVFAFGASIIDSGENAIAMPFRSDAEFAPYGSDHFNKPTGRWSNGRTFLDLIMEGLGYDHLDPYLKSMYANFTYGVNFASSGSTAQNTTNSGTNSGGLFCLLVQVDQFRDYQATVLSNQLGLKAKQQMKQLFSDSIYFFETGSNDYSQYAFSTVDYEPLSSVEVTIASMRQAFETLYAVGARTFIVMNVTPLGCSPGILNDERGNGTFDAYGCKADWMDLVNLHNQHLADLLDDLRVGYPAAEWILFDAHSIFLDGYRNPSKYGLKYPFQACCGSGGKYNVNTDCLCGESVKNVNGTLVEWTKCADPKLHIIWDTIHPVESFGYYVAQGVLNGTHLSPSFDILERVQSIRMARMNDSYFF